LSAISSHGSARVQISHITIEKLQEKKIEQRRCKVGWGEWSVICMVVVVVIEGREVVAFWWWSWWQVWVWCNRECRVVVVVTQSKVGGGCGDDADDDGGGGHEKW